MAVLSPILGEEEMGRGQGRNGRATTSLAPFLLHQPRTAQPMLPSACFPLPWHNYCKETKTIAITQSNIITEKQKQNQDLFSEANYSNNFM